MRVVPRLFREACLLPCAPRIVIAHALDHFPRMADMAHEGFAINIGGSALNTLRVAFADVSGNSSGASGRGVCTA